MNIPKVGDKVWFVPGDNRRDGREITVTKIGKKYFYSDYTKFDAASWEEVSDYSPVRCFISKGQLPPPDKSGRGLSNRLESNPLARRVDKRSYPVRAVPIQVTCYIKAALSLGFTPAKRPNWEILRATRTNTSKNFLYKYNLYFKKFNNI